MILPLNRVQLLQRKALRGVPPIKHDSNSDLALITAYKNGDEEAGMKLLESYMDIISYIFKNPTKPPRRTKQMRKLFTHLNHFDREDMFQEIIYQFFLLVHEYDPSLGKPFENFVKGVLHQRFFNRYFSEVLEDEKHKSKTVEFDDNMNIEEKAKSILLEENELKLPSHYIELYQALNQLGTRQREILILSEVKGWNATEIARELGINPNTVRATKKKAIERLREIMTKASG
jgi:RNA polymerase sigma factor (sigma-70 family)